MLVDVQEAHKDAVHAEDRVPSACDLRYQRSCGRGGQTDADK